MTISELIAALEVFLEQIGDCQICYVEDAGQEYYAFKFPVAVASLDRPGTDGKEFLCALLGSEVADKLQGDEIHITQRNKNSLN